MSAVLPATHDDTAGRWRALRHAASARYGQAGRFAMNFSRGKLRFDPVFRHLLSDGMIAPGARVLDIGCGQGLVGSLLRAADEAFAAGRWPAEWGAAPSATRFTGIELMPREVTRARQALGPGVVLGDMRVTPFPTSDVVVILDVLHYVDLAAQDEVLARARQALSTHGRLLLRVGDVSAGRRHRIGAWIDRGVARLRRGRQVTLTGRTIGDWTARLESLGFVVEARPMSHGTPFANVLLVARAVDGAPRRSA